MSWVTGGVNAGSPMGIGTSFETLWSTLGTVNVSGITAGSGGGLYWSHSSSETLVSEYAGVDDISLGTR